MMMIKKIFIAILFLMPEVLSSQELKCPDKVFSDSELINIVENARKTRSDLPVKLQNYSTKITRLRCLYIITERTTQADTNLYQTFTIDPYGELMDFYINNKQ